MKEIVIRSSISLVLLLLSYITGLAVNKFSLPQILVVGFIISQCLNECVSYTKLNKKEKEIAQLKRKISHHHTMAEDIYDADERPKEEKLALKTLKSEMFKAITSDYMEDDRKYGNNKTGSIKKAERTSQKIIKE